MNEQHPLDSALATWLPSVDFAVLSHGFAAHGRDYTFVLQTPALFELTLTHVVELQYETKIADEVWSCSWDDVFTDQGAWEAAGEQAGYCWWVKYSLAYPGLTLLRDDPGAASWSQRLGKRFHAVLLATNQFRLRIVFHDARARKLSDDK